METVDATDDPPSGPAAPPGDVPDRPVTRPLPLPAERALAKLGSDLNRARRLRRLTQQELAERSGVSLNTVKRLEAGDPRMQLHVLARVLTVFGDVERLAQLLDAGQDGIGLALMDARLPQRVRARKNPTRAF